MPNYNPQKIEPKWQRFWEKQGLSRAKDFSKKPKLYLLVEFPYPSGDGLHVGHCRPYVALDVIARKRRMQGYNVLFPMGWDAFGLPTENYAIKTGIHPAIVTKKNTDIFKKQQKHIGLSFDWSREVNTTDPDYYKWTQWIFLQIFKKGLAYKKKMPVNWCPACKIGLANEEVVEGKCERCGAGVERKEREQWLLKITKYAERLIKDLDLVDYPERVKTLQKDWVGKSEGWEIDFNVKYQNPNVKSNLKSKCQKNIKVFTTRIDTLFGCTYLVLSPEHPILEQLKPAIKNGKAVEQYIKQAKTKLERERLAEAKEKSGVKLEGVTAINPANNKEIPIFVADYVLMNYGTGAIMAVPAHDQRDWLFAKKYNLPIVEVVKGASLLAQQGARLHTSAYEGEGILVNSEQFNGLRSEQAKEKKGHWLKAKGLAEKKVHYKLRDWIFSRQRYWGEPIPLVFCPSCKKQAEIFNFQFSIFKQKGKNLKFNKGEILNPGWVAVPEDDLPVELPDVEDYKPTETGESPLAEVEKWVKTKCPKCGGLAKRETDVMPNWAGSNWYYLAYLIKSQKSPKDPLLSNERRGPTGQAKVKSQEYIWDKKRMRYWMPVDWYNGGMEHTTLHLLYSRFIYKFLWDIGEVPKELGLEPYKKRTSHGMILAEGGVKMSKSKGNVINPDEIIEDYGADTLRAYEMFMGPFSQAIAWDTKGVRGVYRFLEKIYKLKSKIQMSNVKPNPKSKIQNSKLNKLLHQTIKKVSEDIENMKFNTAVASLMILVNAMEKQLSEARPQIIGKKEFGDFLKILAPFAPHLAEELWSQLGFQQSIFLQDWPKYDTKQIKEEKITLVVQVNGKVRDKIEVNKDGLSEEEAKSIALKSEKVQKWLTSKQVNKIIFVPNKLINIVA